MLRMPHCVDNRLAGGGKVLSSTNRPRFTPQKHFLGKKTKAVPVTGRGGL
jgi:hypothetical protein